MATQTIAQPKVDEAVQWLKANPHVVQQSLDSLELGDRCLCETIALRPQTLLKLATKTHQAAVRARAPKDVLAVLKLRKELVKSGLANLPRFAYSWFSICQMIDIESKAKAGSFLTQAALLAPDKLNENALHQLAGSVSGRRRQDGGRVSAKLPCLLCCALGCLECGPLCIGCCLLGCLICMATERT
jgi:hypothetical protein